MISYPVFEHKSFSFKLIILGALILFTSLTPLKVNAAECAGVSHPEKIRVDNLNLSLNGIGVREATVFKVDVYVAALYLQEESSSGNLVINSSSYKKLVLKFVRNVSKQEVSEAWLEGFKESFGQNLEALKGKINKLNSWMIDLERGSTLSFTFKNSLVSIGVNGVQKGVIKGTDFTKSFLGIWLGPSPPNEGLKIGLLGGECG